MGARGNRAVLSVALGAGGGGSPPRRLHPGAGAPPGPEVLGGVPPPGASLSSLPPPPTLFSNFGPSSTSTVASCPSGFGLQACAGTSSQLATFLVGCRRSDILRQAESQEQGL